MGACVSSAPLADCRCLSIAARSRDALQENAPAPGRHTLSKEPGDGCEAVRGGREPCARLCHNWSSAVCPARCCRPETHPLPAGLWPRGGRRAAPLGAGLSIGIHQQIDRSRRHRAPGGEGTLDYTDPLPPLPRVRDGAWRTDHLGDIFTHSTGLRCISLTDFIARGVPSEEGCTSLFAGSGLRAGPVTSTRRSPTRFSTRSSGAGSACRCRASPGEPAPRAA